MYKINIKTTKPKEVVDITKPVAEFVKGQKVDEGLVNIFVTHTTMAVATADLDEGGTDLDYLDALDRIIPKLNYRHPHDPKHMPDHILSSLIGTSLNIPFKEKKLFLGTWQKIILFEFNGPRNRTIILSIYNG